MSYANVYAFGSYSGTASFRGIGPAAILAGIDSNALFTNLPLSNVGAYGKTSFSATGGTISGSKLKSHQFPVKIGKGFGFVTLTNIFPPGSNATIMPPGSPAYGN